MPSETRKATDETQPVDQTLVSQAEGGDISALQLGDVSPVANAILALERAALARWCRGDPSGYLEICAADVVYFDPFVARRIDGCAALAAYYEPIRGNISAERFELLNPVVQELKDAAVLTFNFVSTGKDQTQLHWNCTEVYRRDSVGWRIIQSHWSFTART